MSIRTTVTLDDDVVARLKELSAAKRVPFRKLLNDLLRAGFSAQNSPAPRQRFVVNSANLGVMPGVDLDNIGATLEALEGPTWR